MFEVKTGQRPEAILGHRQSWHPSLRRRAAANFAGLVLGCIEADFLQANTYCAACFEIYKIYSHPFGCKNARIFHHISYPEKITSSGRGTYSLAKVVFAQIFAEVDNYVAKKLAEIKLIYQTTYW